MERSTNVNGKTHQKKICNKLPEGMQHMHDIWGEKDGDHRNNNGLLWEGRDITIPDRKMIYK